MIEPVLVQKAFYYWIKYNSKDDETCDKIRPVKDLLAKIGSAKVDYLYDLADVIFKKLKKVKLN